MENLLDLIVPLIFLIVFSLSSLSKQKKGKGGERGSDEGEPLPPFGGKDPLTEIREEIQRKIRENQQSQRQPASPSNRTPSQARMSPEQASTSTYEERMAQRRTQLQQQQKRQNREAAAHMAQMQRMQKQVQDMQKRAEAEKRKAASVTGSKSMGKALNGRTKSRSRYMRSGLVGDVIRDLKRPESSRKAVLNAEILGTPVGLRRPSQNQALWGN